MDMFLKRETPPQEPQAGPSGGVPEEGIIILGDDSYSSQYVAALEDLPEEQNVEMEDDTDDPDPVQAQANVFVCILVFDKKFKKLK